MAFSVRVTLVGKTPIGTDETSLVFAADYGNGANEEWAKYTPVYNQNMTVKNSVVEAEGLEVGDKFEGVFTKLN